MGLLALGHTTKTTHFDNSTLVEVFDSGNGVHKLHIDKKTIPAGEVNRTIVGFLGKLTSKLIEERRGSDSKGVVNS